MRKNNEVLLRRGFKKYQKRRAQKALEESVPGLEPGDKLESNPQPPRKYVSLMLGASTKYMERVKPNLAKIKKMRASGATMKQICQCLGVGKQAMYTYRYNSEELREALEKGKQELTVNLEQTLLQRALGTKVVDRKSNYLVDDDGNKVLRSVEEVEKISQSDVCLLFALRNLAPEKWCRSLAYEPGNICAHNGAEININLADPSKNETPE